MVVDIATGEVEDRPVDDGKDPAVLKLGRKGGANGFSKKLENHLAAVALHFAHFNLVRPHKTLATTYPRTPAMAAGVTDHVWTLTEIVGLLD